MTPGAYIRRKREERQMTMTRLAKDLSLPLPYLCDLELGRRKNPDLFPKIAERLYLSLDYLYYLAGMIPPDIQAMELDTGEIARHYETLRKYYAIRTTTERDRSHAYSG